MDSSYRGVRKIEGSRNGDCTECKSRSWHCSVWFDVDYYTLVIRLKRLKTVVVFDTRHLIAKV